MSLAKEVLRLGAMKLLDRSILLFLYIITTHDDHRNTVALSHHQFRGGSDFVGYRRYGRLELVTVPIFQSSLVLHRLHSSDTDGNVHSPDAPRTAKAVTDNHCRVLAGALLNRIAYLPCRMIGIFRQERNLPGTHVGLVNPCVGANEAMVRLHDQSATAGTNHPAAFAQNDFDECRLFVQSRG